MYMSYAHYYTRNADSIQWGELAAHLTYQVREMFEGQGSDTPML